MTQTITVKPFTELTAEEVHDIFQLRFEVFVLEQRCYEVNEIDGLDKSAYHVCIKQRDQMTEQDSLLAYSRFYRRSDDDSVVIGRVVTQRNARGQGLGGRLLETTLESIINLYPESQVRIHAQHDKLAWYQKYGFIPQGEAFMEDGIEHVAMIRPCPRHALTR